MHSLVNLFTSLLSYSFVPCYTLEWLRCCCRPRVVLLPQPLCQWQWQINISPFASFIYTMYIPSSMLTQQFPSLTLLHYLLRLYSPFILVRITSEVVSLREVRAHSWCVFIAQLQSLIIMKVYSNKRYMYVVASEKCFMYYYYYIISLYRGIRLSFSLDSRAL